MLLCCCAPGQVLEANMQSLNSIALVCAALVQSLSVTTLLLWVVLENMSV